MPLPQHPSANMTRVSPGGGGELCSRHLGLLPAASDLSPGSKRAGEKGKFYLHRLLQHQQSPQGPCQTEPLQALSTSGSCYRKTFVSPETNSKRKAASHGPQLNQCHSPEQR